MNLQQALQGTRPVLVEFYSATCPHCQKMAPIVAELKKKVSDRADVIQIEGYENIDTTRQYHVKHFPTWIIFKDGQECWRDSGEKPLSELTDMIDRFV